MSPPLTAAIPPDSERPGSYSRLHPLTPLLRGWAFLVAGAIAVGQQLFRGDLDVLELAVTGVAVMAFGVAAGAVSWWFTRFVITAEELRVESGVFVRRSRRIPIERLQAVDVVQPLAGRMLGLAEVRLEVAGGSGTESALAYLPLAEAHQVRRTLLAGAAGRRDEPGEARDEPPTGAELVVRVSPGLLLTGLLLSSRFLSAVLGFAALAGVLALADQPVGAPLLLAEIGAVGALVLRTFLAEYGFTLTEAAGGLRIRRGLLDVRFSTVLPGRVQGIVVRAPLLWRPRGWVRVEVDVAGYAGGSDDSTGESASTLLPISSGELADVVTRRVLPGVAVGEVPLVPVPARARWVAPFAWRFLAVGSDESAVVTRSGWLDRRTDVVPLAKIQSVRIRQGPLQRRLALADVLVDSPPGPLDATAKHRPSHEARALALILLHRARLARRADEEAAAPSGRVRGVSTPRL